MNADASAKIKMLNSSLRCFVFGLLGLLPIIGLPFAFAALWISGRVRAREKHMWNAAQPYRIWGVVCAAAGTVFWFFIVVLIVCNSIRNGGPGGNYGFSGE
jgi:uncharacterized protein YybS (DUF2232 family)